jgi:hypothetical protein
MDKIRKFELMEKIVHELEDLKNSQQAIITKLAKIEVDNLTWPIKDWKKTCLICISVLPITLILLPAYCRILQAKPTSIAARTISRP